MSDEPRDPLGSKRRPLRSKLLELALWFAVALITAWILIQNVDRILPANNF